MGLRREKEREREREGVLSKTQNGSVRLEREGGFNNFNDSFFFSFFPPPSPSPSSSSFFRGNYGNCNIGKFSP